MRFTILPLFAVLIFSCTTEKNINGIKGKVSEVILNKFVASETNGVIYDKFVMKTYLYKYDKDGFLISIKETDRKNNLLSTAYVEAYHHDGQVQSLKTLGPENELIQEVHKSFNAQNQLLTENHSGEFAKRIAYTYKNGKRHTGTWKNEKGLEFKNFEYEWNSEGDLIKETVLLPSGKIIEEFTFKYQYDAKSNWIVKQQYKNGELIDYFERKITYAK